MKKLFSLDSRLRRKQRETRCIFIYSEWERVEEGEEEGTDGRA